MAIYLHYKARVRDHLYLSSCPLVSVIFTYSPRGGYIYNEQQIKFPLSSVPMRYIDRLEIFNQDDTKIYSAKIPILDLNNKLDVFIIPANELKIHIDPPKYEVMERAEGGQEELKEIQKPKRRFKLDDN